MNDIHCHILPNLDDGPRDWNEAMRMAVVAVNNGIHSIIATPHHGIHGYVNPSEKITREVHIFNQMLQEKGISLQVHAGQEIHFNNQIFDEYDRGHLLPLGDSKSLLIELPIQTIPSNFYEFVSYMKTKNLQVIVAHPERYTNIIDNPHIVKEWVERGIRTQLTASALLGLSGRKIQKTAMTLISYQFAHYIASDAHNTILKGFYMREGYYKLAEMFGQERMADFQRRADTLIETPITL
ncbi:hypothetical protein NV379_00370 [Paenibacillus sp. N1-5-1-14]|uniref:tyrosine-protein phosphatase n=1 Tax=Paenibacillus radicibacter TaxID=2972488 RepID=UPI0021595069|nr:CpsB/CapC family capsule biosynthesis tyrosine phosphatase [Paenibacillus radicibacter]MCR8641096.1 hypothetical protein [Paenibacillus radicibacter]